MRQAVRSERGMTLVEVMVSAVVLSMVMLALSASLRTFATTYAAVEQVAEQTDRLRSVTYFLRHALREAYYPHPGSFHQTADEVVWLAPMDRVGAASGLMWLRLRKQSDKLLLDFAVPNQDETEMADKDPIWGRDIGSEVLLNGLDRVRFHVLPSAGEGWAKSSEFGSEFLPAAISVSIEMADIKWPPIVVALDGHKDPAG